MPLYVMLGDCVQDFDCVSLGVALADALDDAEDDIDVLGDELWLAEAEALGEAQTFTTVTNTTK